MYTYLGWFPGSAKDVAIAIQDIWMWKSQRVWHLKIELSLNTAENLPENFWQQLALQLHTLDCHFELSLEQMGLELMLNCMGSILASYDPSWV